LFETGLGIVIGVYFESGVVDEYMGVFSGVLFGLAMVTVGICVILEISFEVVVVGIDVGVVNGVSIDLEIVVEIVCVSLVESFKFFFVIIRSLVKGKFVLLISFL
jgi:hypothetical protein